MFTTLRSKIIAGFGVLIAVHLVFTLWAVNQFSEMADRSRIVAGDLAGSSSDLLSLAAIASDQYRVLRDRRPVEDRERAFQSGSGRFKNAVGSDYSAISRSHEQFSRVGMELIAAMKAGDEVSFGSLERAFDSLQFNLFEAGRLLRVEVNGYQRELANESRDMLVTVSLASLIAAIIGVFSGVVYSRWALHSIDRLRTAVKAVRHGEFSQTVHISSADELGDLTFEFNRMIEELQRYQAMNVEALLSERRRLQMVVQSIGTPIVMVDEHLQVLFANPPALRLFQRPIDSPAEGLPLSSMIEDSGLVALLEEMAMSDRDHSGQSGATWQFEREGALLYYSVVRHELERVRGGQDVVRAPETLSGGSLFLFTNVTEFKQLDALKSELLARVSHELRTPLTSVVMGTDLIGRGHLGPVTSDQEELLEEMKGSLRRLSTMIDEILLAARAENQVLPGEVLPYDIAPELRLLIEEHGAAASERKVDITLRIDESTELPVAILPEHFRQVVGNLLSNAIRYSGEGGSVSVAAASHGAQVSIAVSDEGPGIPLAKRERVFEKFYQVERGIPHPHGSLGLGLSVVKDIVLRYNGTISLASEEGRGSTFTVQLPAGVA